MLEIFFAMMAATMGGAQSTQVQGTATVQIMPESTIVGVGTVIEGKPSSPTAPPAPATGLAEFNMDAVPAGLIADPQTPTGKFTTAAEVKPILNATKGNWVAVREFDGQDLLYVTHLWSWRCGIKAIAISVNGERMQNWPLPLCHEEFATPNAILPEDGNPYLTLRQGSVQSITIQVVYDDLSMDAATFARGDVMIP